MTPGPPGDPGRTGQRSRGWSRGRLAGWLYGCAAAVYGLDRLTKFLAETYLQGRPPVHVIPGVVQLDYTTNPGGAFGGFQGIMLDPRTGVLMGGSDVRKDGLAIGY